MSSSEDESEWGAEWGEQGSYGRSEVNWAEVKIGVKCEVKSAVKIEVQSEWRQVSPSEVWAPHPPPPKSSYPALASFIGKEYP